jgi:YD repeat-containing protein
MTGMSGVKFQFMGILAENIRRAVREERYGFGYHAQRRLRERRITGRQVVQGLEEAKLLAERADGDPLPVAEFEQELADGTPIKAVWAWNEDSQEAKLVTVHFFPRLSTWE